MMTKLPVFRSATQATARPRQEGSSDVMSSDDDTRSDEQFPLTSGDGNGRAVVKHKVEPRRKKSAEEHGRDQTEQMNALFQWAQKVLKARAYLRRSGTPRPAKSWMPSNSMWVTPL